MFYYIQRCKTECSCKDNFQHIFVLFSKLDFVMFYSTIFWEFQYLDEKWIRLSKKNIIFGWLFIHFLYFQCHFWAMTMITTMKIISIILTRPKFLKNLSQPLNHPPQGNLLRTIDNKTIRRWFFEIVYICSLLSTVLLE